MLIGALTTVFKPGPGCNDMTYGKIFTSASVRDEYYSLGQTDMRSCYPPSFKTPSAYYSPGLCPSQWSSACGTVESIGTMTETRVTCCPVGYVCATTRAQPWYTFSCSQLAIDSPGFIVFQEYNGPTKYVQTVLGGPITIFAEQIEVRYQEADFQTGVTTTRNSSSGTHTQTITSSFASRVSGTGESRETETGGREKGGGLPVGAFVGIGLGVAVALLVCIWVILCVLRRRRGKVAKVEKTSTNGGLTHENSAAEMAVCSPTWEMGQREVGEVNGDTFMPVEIGGKARIHQLE